MWKLALLMLWSGSDALAGEEFWQALQPLCGKAYAGRMVEGTEPSDEAFASRQMVMHVAHCSPTEIRIPFQVDDDRSRTWVLTRGADFVRLKHAHRHEDGSDDNVTHYGGDARATGGTQLEFPADRYTADLLPAAATNVWTMVVEPGKHFSYALRREAQGRRFRVEFDLGQPVPVPPPAW